MQRLSAALSGRYAIERELGQGGMATVYLAHDVRHDRRVALKVLRPELAAILGGDRFLAEIKTTANLQHPHILSLFDSGEADGLVYYVMPYVEGESLRDRITREKQLPVEEAVRIAREVADALQYAHTQGIVHRDIKPENILLHGGHAMVADFGIALAASRSDGGTRMTETGMSLGTPHYMAPEQAMGEREITPKADVYALGCVLYEMLTGEPPFIGATAQAIIARVMTEAPRSLTLQRRTIPPHVEAAVERALEKLPADRFATAAEFASALERGDAMMPMRRMPHAARPGGAFVGRSMVPWVIVALMVASGAWAWLRPRPAPDVNRFALALPDSQRLSIITDRRLALSHDGRTLVYSGVMPGGTRLYLLRRDALDPVPLAGTDNALNPAFSPDDRQLAFVSGTPRALRVLTLAGGAVTTITDSLVDRGGVTWSDDGYIYYDGHLAGDGIARVRATGGSPEPVTQPRTDSGEIWHAQPEALPGGGIVFAARKRSGTLDYDLAVTDGRPGSHRAIGRGIGPRYAGGYLVYSNADGALMAAPFSARRRRFTGEPRQIVVGVGTRAQGRTDVALSAVGTMVYAQGSAAANEAELVWVTPTGGVTAVDPDWRGNLRSVSLSPDGRRAAVIMTHELLGDIWIKSLDRGPATRLTFEGVNTSPAWSPDGRSLLFASAPAPQSVVVAVMSSPADGSRVPQVVRRDSLSGGTAVWQTRDGQWLILQSRGLIFGTRTQGDSALRELVNPGNYNAAMGRVSPDGRWLAYMSDESGRFEIYVRPFPNTAAAKWQVSTTGGGIPLWSRDGRTLYFQSLLNQVMAADVRAGPVFAAATPRLLFQYEGMVPAGSGTYYDVAADGRFLMLRNTSGQRDDRLVVVENAFQLFAERQDR